MKTSRVGLLAAATVMTTLFAGAAQAQPLAFRHSALSCFPSSGSATMVDLYDAAVSPLHDWVFRSNWGGSGALVENKVFCPVAIHVPTVLGTPIDGARVVYATLGQFNVNTAAGPVAYKPEISSCSAYLMDSTAGGTWSVDSPAPSAGMTADEAAALGLGHNFGNTGSYYTNGIISIRGGPTISMGGGALNRMVVTCQVPKFMYEAGTNTVKYPVVLKGYEVTYWQ
jgi:hypothetical protein